MAHLSSKAEMILLLGQKGINLRLDDQSSTTDAVEQALIYADQTIRFYTDRFYRIESLYGNAWTKSRATIIATNYLSFRRGNKELFGNEMANVMKELDMISNGYPIPDATPFATNAPSVRLQRVVATGGPTPLKVDPANSMGDGYPDEDLGPPWSNQYYGY